MARYSDNREQNREVKYLYKVWSKVDSNIELPPTLTGDALLPLLKDIPEPVVKAQVREAPKPRQPYRRIRFSPHVFSWKSGATYAAALVLIVALASMLGRNPSSPDIQEGVIVTEPGAAPVRPESFDLPVSEEEAIAQAENNEAGDAPAGAESAAANAQVPEAGTQSTQPLPTDPATAAEIRVDLGAAHGGPSEAILLGEAGDYTCYWRSNDASDPDKGAFPVTINVLHTNTGVLAFEIDIQDMRTVDEYFVYEGALTVVGQSAAVDGVACKTYDLSRVGQPSEQFSHRQPGALLDARLYQNVVTLITYASADEDPGCETVSLPESLEDGQCIITAIDLATNQMSQKAFVGASAELSPGNHNIYLQYEGDKTEENPSGRYVAHVRMSGIDIELRGNETDPATEETVGEPQPTREPDGADRE